MALNPAFESPSTRKLPLAFGYILGAGDLVLQTTAQDGSEFALYVLGEGEWDGYELVNTFAVSGAGIPSHIRKACISDSSATNWTTETKGVLHFHSGAYSVKGAGRQTTSHGPDQGYDTWFPQFPSPTPPQCLSGIAYALFGKPGPPGFSRGTYQPSTISGMAVWRTTRCRIFDAYGSVVSYGFTCNPVWHRVEAILRYKIKPQQPPIAGLTEAEKACFNWPSIAELAARNDYILPNGSPRFIGSYIFAADSSLTNILELSMRCDRSFQRVDGGQIYMIGDDARSSVFIATAKHLVQDSLKLEKKDVSKAGNIFVPRYRDLEIPAVAQVITATQSPQFFSGSTSEEGYVVFNTSTPSPFENASYATYGGAADSSFDGDYQVSIAPGSPYPPSPPANPNYTFGYIAGSGRNATTTGGYLGSQDARFSARAPIGVQHRSAQQMVAAQAPGLAVQPRLTKVFYDCGNSTFDQTNRLMKFERDRSLGTDTGAGWAAPIAGTLTLYFECVDSQARRLCDVRVHDVITLDDWLYPEAPGDYEVLEFPTITPPSERSLGMIEISLMAYNPDAPTDVSDDPGSYYAAVPNSGLKLTGFTPAINPAYTLVATPMGVLAPDGSITVTIPNLLVQIAGIAGSTAYPTFSVASVPAGTVVLLYVGDPGAPPYVPPPSPPPLPPTGGPVIPPGPAPSATGATSPLPPTFGMQAGPGPFVPPSPGAFLVLSGSFAVPAGTAVGSAPVQLIYSPLFAS